VHFIKCYDEQASEEDWYTFMLEPLGINVHSSLGSSVVEDNVVYAIIGSIGLRHVAAKFLKQLNTTRGKGLLHTGDDFLAGGYDLYCCIDFVLRD
jgi:hypothetical protein